MTVKVSYTRKDNTGINAKLRLRKKFISFYENPKILEVYGSQGLMWKQLYRFYNVTTYVKGMDVSQFDLIDMDAWSNPTQYLNVFLPQINKKTSLIITDNAMDLKIRGKIPKKFKNVKGLSPGRHLATQYPKIWYKYFHEDFIIEDFTHCRNKASTFYIGMNLTPK